MVIGMNVIGGKGKGKQEVQGVSVIKMGKEFVFNYNTSLSPAPEDIEFLKIFRNRFVDELNKLNIVLGHIPE